MSKTINRCRTIFSPRIVDFAPTGDVSLTDKQFLPDCDIATIMKRCACGDNSVVRKGTPMFVDISDIGNLADNMLLVTKAKNEFDALPSNIREKFDNDPIKMINYLTDSSNDEEAIELGLKVKPTEAVEPIESVTKETSKSGDVTPTE